MRRRACVPHAAATIALATTLGCAPVQPPGATSVAQPPAAKGAAHHAAEPATGSAAGERKGAAVGNTVSGGSIVSSGATAAVVESGPSADAMAVLATIPEPLSASERVPPPSAGTRSGAAASSAGAGRPAASGAAAGAGAGGAAASGAAAGASGGAAAASGAAAGAGAAPGAAVGAAAAATIAGGRPDTTAGAGVDTAAAAAASDSVIPVPAPTEPLGERRENFARSLVDTLPAAPPAAPPPAPAKAGPDSCWRIQVAAPPSKQEAELRREAAQSVLLLPFVVEHEKQRYKVRNRDCLARDAADRLRRRAIQSGFAGSFPVVEVKR